MNVNAATLVLFLFFFFRISEGISQKKTSTNLVYVDKKGVLRYHSSNAEASFFGVNYTTPFAHAYRAHLKLGIDPEQAIRNDVYHFARLGLDAFRVHIWDTEISDSAGNLLNNEHLRLYDYLLAELKKRGIKTIITPIAFWGNGYPEPDDPTPGFSRYFGRGKLTTNDTAIRAQGNFMQQLFRHVNPYTKLSYENDKDIIAVELNNEPSHSDPKKNVTDYINRLAQAVKSTGWTKPVFYNIAQGPYFSDAVAASVVDGFSFQWYPTALVGNQTLKGNSLMHVDTYRIPFRDTVTAFSNRALMVYEFDAADIMGSYMYPAMAKAFRSAGFQWATQFAYDPMAIANVNTEYQTHYLNLAYTPSKAISMLIASEAFHQLPRLKNFGTYPADSSFDIFRVSYDNSLSEMNSPEKFYYSNTTSTNPANNKQLKNIAGVGNSPVVQYDGTGAYFIDKVSEGVWRLEVMPDVIYIRDPFERASPKKEVTAINWTTHEMELKLDNLGEGFSIKGMNDGNTFTGLAKKNNFNISPGTYLLVKAGSEAKGGIDKVGSIGLSEFVAPPASKKEIIVRHQPLTEVSSGRSFRIQAIISGIDSGRVIVQLSKPGGGLFRNIPMIKKGYNYTAEVPAEIVTDGQLQYRIIAQEGGNFVSYPGAITGNPGLWDNFQTEFYKTNIAAQGSSLELYNPSTDRTVQILPNFRRGFQAAYSSGSSTGAINYKLSITGIQQNEVMGLQYFIGDKLMEREAELSGFNNLILRAGTNGNTALVVKITFINRYGAAYAATASIDDKIKDFEIPLDSFKPSDSSLLMPRPYPGFQPLYFKSPSGFPVLKPDEIEKIQITIEAGLQSSENKNYNLEIESVKLSK